MTGKHRGKSTLFTMTGLCDGEIELPHLLRDLHALALNPFHCAIQMIQIFIMILIMELEFESK
ncbi:hypothetical protein LINPERHAP1_LOCUS14166 [Linum perenne]